MTERFRQIYDFLQLNYFDIHSDTYPSTKFYDQNEVPIHYNCDQINMWSNLNVKEKELKAMEKLNLVGHFYFKDHGNCYYAIIPDEIKKIKLQNRWVSFC